MGGRQEAQRRRIAARCLERPLTLPTDPDPMQYFIMPNLDKNPALMGELLAEMQDPNDPNNTVERDLTEARFIRMVARLGACLRIR